MPEQLVKMRAQDLLGVLLEYCTARESEETAAWRAWNNAWERADESLRRDALMICGVHLTEARRKLREVANG